MLTSDLYVLIRKGEEGKEREETRDDVLPYKIKNHISFNAFEGRT